MSRVTIKVTTKGAGNGGRGARRTSTARKIGREKAEWSLCDLGMMADIEKDMAKSFKSLVHTHQMLNEKSIEKY